MAVAKQDATLSREFDGVVDKVRNDLGDPVTVGALDTIRDLLDKAYLHTILRLQTGRLLDIGE